MPPKQKYTDPKLRDEVKEEVKQSDKGGEPGQWSARKAQMMAKEYKNRGGDYNTPKTDKDESQKHLDKWTDEDWQTKEGSGEAKKDDGSRKRYLPKKAWEQMNEKEKRETDQKKQKGSKEGKQYVRNTGKAQKARKDVSDGEEENGDDQEDENNKAKQNGANKSPSTRNQSKQKGQQSDKKSSISEQSNSDAISEEEEDAQKENQSPAQGQKRGRKQTDEGKKNELQTPKKQKTSDTDHKNDGKTVGSKHDKATPPAKQGSASRLPKKGQKNVHWKAMPGWVEGEVVEVVQKDKDVDGKNVKASKNDPKVVLKSKSSGKLCVHKADNVYFD